MRINLFSISLLFLCPLCRISCNNDIDELPIQLQHAIYNELFRNKKERAVPEYILITPDSKIVLLKEYEGLEDYPMYKIYTEPFI